MLSQAGFDAATARRLAQKRSLAVIQRQLQWLPLRTIRRSRLGLLRRAIEQDWPKPEVVEASTEVAGPLTPQARVFASHYYAGYHDYTGEAATEPFPKDLETGAQFVARLLAQEGSANKLADWGRRFGQLMRTRHRDDPKAKPNLSFALVLYGDRFLRLLSQERSAREQAALGRARQAHQAAFEAEYRAYLVQAEQTMQQTAPALYAAFVASREQARRVMVGGKFLLSAETLARFDSEASRLRSFAEFFQRHPQQPVPDFWEWDARLNPHGFGRAPLPTPAPEARA